MQPLESLIQPITVDRFFDEYWERRPSTLRGDCPGYYDALLSLDEIDRVLTTRDLRYPNVIRGKAEPDCADAGGLALDSGRHFGRKITFPLHAAPAVRFALSRQRFAVRDLPGVWMTPANSRLLEGSSARDC